MTKVGIAKLELKFIDTEYKRFYKEVLLMMKNLEKGEYLDSRYSQIYGISPNSYSKFIENIIKRYKKSEIMEYYNIIQTSNINSFTKDIIYSKIVTKIHEHVAKGKYPELFKRYITMSLNCFKYEELARYQKRDIPMIKDMIKDRVDYTRVKYHLDKYLIMRVL